MRTAIQRRDPTPERGPCMRLLPPKWARAVDALFLSGGDRSKALVIAGYEGKPASINVMASRIFGDARVRAAIKEECLYRIDASEPELYAITMNILRDTGEKAADRLRAIEMVWSRANPVMTRHKIEVEHHMTDDERDIRHWHALKKLGATADAFLARFGPNGLPRVEALVLAEEAKRREIESGSTIEGEVIEEVTEEVSEVPRRPVDDVPLKSKDNLPDAPAPSPATNDSEPGSEFDEDLL
jgi:hypothetical protein